MAKKKYDIEANSKMEQMRFSVAEQMGFLPQPILQNWWENLTPMQKSQVNGAVTKLLITKAQVDIANGIKIHE